MSDDLLRELDFCANFHASCGQPENSRLFRSSAARIRELESRLATAEADAMERAARVLSRASEEIRALKPKADK